MQAIKTIAIIGTGVIGASWTAFFLSKGFVVHAYDPAEDAQGSLINRVKIYLEDLYQLNDIKDISINDYSSALLNHLSFYVQLEEAVKDVGFIQENGPERIELKIDLYAKITQYCPAKSIIASSSSGLKISDIQKNAIHPERIVLGHPFNPPHLLPLVEIVGGQQTHPQTIHTAFDFYQSLGKTPILIHKEVKGHVANRLQSAIWREAFYLVSEGVCSAEDIDLAITNGPGLRWAILGPFLNMQLANQQGFKAAMHHLGGPMSEWWADMQPYTLTDQKIDLLTEQTQTYLNKIGNRNLQQLRDQALLQSLKSKKQLDLP